MTLIQAASSAGASADASIFSSAGDSAGVSASASVWCPVRWRALATALSALMLGVALALVAAAPAQAFTLSDGTEAQCPLNRNGKTGVATERWVQYKTLDERDPELGKAVAVVRTDPQGWPLILIDAVAYQQSKGVMAAMWDFIYFHECAHARDPRLSEIGANCAAYLAMQDRGLMNAIRFKDIEAAHLRILNLPEQYGGNGIEFWKRTLDCVDRQQSDPSAALDMMPESQ